MAVSPEALVLLASNATALAGAGVYTSPDLEGGPQFKRLCGHVYSDVAGTLDLQIKITSDSTYFTYQSVPASAGVPSVFDYPACASIVRVRYTNGAGAQAKFQLQVFGGKGL